MFVYVICLYTHDGVSWTVHASPASAMVKKVDKSITCPDGGFLKLQEHLLSQVDVNCEICLRLLKSTNFSQAALDALLAVPSGAEIPAEEPVDAPDEGPPGAGESGRAEPDPAEPAAEFDWQEYVGQFAGIIELLPPGSFGKTLPYRCKVCRSRRWPTGRVGDLCHTRETTLKHFLHRHLDCNSHQANLKKHQGLGPGVESAEAEDDSATIACQGIFLDDPTTARSLHHFQAEVELWLSMSNPDESPNGKHEYKKVQVGDVKKWHVRSSRCLKEMQSKSHGARPPVCAECFQLGAGDSIVRCAQRYAVKFYAAELLSSRLFQGEVGGQETFDRLSQTSLYKQNRYKCQEVLNHDTARLQIWVRGSWNDHHMRPECQRFYDLVVNPCLRVSIASVPEKLSEMAATFDLLIRGKQCSDAELINLQVASSAMKGQLERHPLLLGLTLQTARKLEKEERGLTTMAGRRSAESELATALIRDSGLQLACATANNALIKEFGLSGSAGRFKYAELERMSLPSPALALNYPEILENNFVLADQRFVCKPQSNRRSWAVLGHWGFILC